MCDPSRLSQPSLSDLAPGCFHIVYTPVNSWCIGGHYISYGNLVLTLRARLAEAYYGELITNKSPLSAEQTLFSMAIQLDGDRQPTLDHDAFIVLILMVFWPGQFCNIAARTNLRPPKRKDSFPDIEDVTPTVEPAHCTTKPASLPTGFTQAAATKLQDRTRQRLYEVMAHNALTTIHAWRRFPSLANYQVPCGQLVKVPRAPDP
jgi:hypothetical protein